MLALRNLRDAQTYETPGFSVEELVTVRSVPGQRLAQPVAPPAPSETLAETFVNAVGSAMSGTAEAAPPESIEGAQPPVNADPSVVPALVAIPAPVAAAAPKRPAAPKSPEPKYTVVQLIEAETISEVKFRAP